jgi:ribosome biogenesis GTPase
MNQGQVFKIHSDFYYVDGQECKAREILKKRKEKIFTGDIVEFENGVIERILPRKNFIPRPACANIDQIVIVSALDNTDLTQLDRYIAFARYYQIPVKLCFNKDDLSHGNFPAVYKDYDTAMTSAIEHTGLEEFFKLLEGKTSVLCGNSGVGKSSLINALNPVLKLKTGAVSEKTNRGTHTTCHCEIIKLNNACIVDTPGFSNLKFDFLTPREVSGLFEEFPAGCKFSDCLHISEDGCAVRGNVPQSRYESYLTFVEEARVFRKTKSETSRFIGNRVAGRNTQKQQVYKEVEND